MADHKKVKASKKSVFDSIKTEDKDFFVTSLEKKIRNINKKLKEIENLEQQQLEKELKPEQIEKVNQKDSLLNKIKEIEEVGSIWKEALHEKKKEDKDKNLFNNDNTKATLQILFAAKASFNNQIEANPELSNLWNVLFSHGQDTVQTRINQALNLLPKIQISEQILAQVENLDFPAPQVQHVVVQQVQVAQPEEVKLEVQEHYSIQKKVRKQSHNSNSARKPSTKQEDFEQPHEEKHETPLQPIANPVTEEKEAKQEEENKTTEKHNEKKPRTYKGERSHRNHYQKKGHHDRDHREHHDQKEHREHREARKENQAHDNIEDEDDDFQTVGHSHPQHKTNTHHKHHDNKEKKERNHDKGNNEKREKQARPVTGKPVVSYVAKQEPVK